MKHTKLLGLSLAVLAACSSSTSSSDPVAISQAQRVTAPVVPAADATALRDGNTAFAFDMYRSLRTAKPGTNVFFSPYSISLALAMTYAGARGTTATEMAKTLHFTLPDAQLHPAFDELDLALTSRGPVTIADSLWGATDAAFEPAFLDTLAKNYGAGVRLTDFGNGEQARTRINGWVSDQTHDRIADLLPSGSINGDTRLVLVNAIYFKGTWQSQFEKTATSDAPFHAPTGDVTAPTMHATQSYPYAKGDGYQAVALPYEAGLSLVAVLPDEGTAFDASLDGAKWAQITAGLTNATVQLSLPKVAIKGATVALKPALGALGMPAAFDIEKADLTGMSSEAAPDQWHIDDVYHQAFVAIDETGSEAAAATAVDVARTTAVLEDPKQVVLTFDRPFVFAIRDDATGALLFLGHVENPAN